MINENKLSELHDLILIEDLNGVQSLLEKNKEDIVELLTISFKPKSFSNLSALQRLVIEGNYEILRLYVRYLTQEQIMQQINTSVDMDGLTPVQIAMEQDYFDILKLFTEVLTKEQIYQLIVKKAGLGLNEGITTLEYVICESGFTILLFLIDKLNLELLNKCDENGESLLHLAIRSVSFDKDKANLLIKYLLAKGADRQLKNRTGMRPIDLAEKLSAKKACSLLSSKMANQITSLIDSPQIHLLKGLISGECELTQGQSLTVVNHSEESSEIIMSLSGDALRKTLQEQLNFLQNYFEMNPNLFDDNTAEKLCALIDNTRQMRQRILAEDYKPELLPEEKIETLNCFLHNWGSVISSTMKPEAKVQTCSSNFFKRSNDNEIGSNSKRLKIESAIQDNDIDFSGATRVC